MSLLAVVSAARSDDWQSSGSCASSDPEVFFPERGASDKWAKKVCSRCAVTVACLGAALQGGEAWGVWGGLSESERRRLTPEQRSSAIYAAADQRLRVDKFDAA